MHKFAAGELQSSISANLAIVQERMAAACQQSGRDGNAVRLVVVSKGQPVEVIAAAIQAGASIFGENYAELAVPKINALNGTLEVEWHMIGHVQSRKAGLVCKYFDFMHSLDSLKLAEKLNLLAGEHGSILPVLLEINIGGEESKGGWQLSKEGKLDFAYPEFERIAELPNLALRGLMTMPPLFDEPELCRPYFHTLMGLREKLKEDLHLNDFSELSMGTSADYEIAIEEGATMVRVGQAILGPRPVKTREDL